MNALFSGRMFRCTGRTSLSLIVNLMLSVEKLRDTQPNPPAELKRYVRPATDCCVHSHEADCSVNTAINFMAYPVLACLRISLEVDAKSAMLRFLGYDFAGIPYEKPASRMRHTPSCQGSPVQVGAAVHVAPKSDFDGCNSMCFSEPDVDAA
ncbi:hypothetical protein EJ08DRAFT_703599 [Tothia fuscella]|uniref:Uncharacterized protein n=1 Tax=Tothia fuscella TaxID=1048955 RepID=A0A9P4NE16_9PEZI|nr:hypothetical protein EJ08DRAFT_703599 [Tothia fuscella]